MHRGWQKSAHGLSTGRDYPQPLVDHAEQRQKALALFGKN
jgi:deoxyribodipyrimidine photo-lyase